MKLKDYIDVCVKFAAKTSSWDQLDPYKMYLTDGNFFYESSDGNCPGIVDVSWAFHLTEEEVRKNGPQQFIDAVHELIDSAIDNDLDKEEIRDLIDILLN